MGTLSGEGLVAGALCAWGGGPAGVQQLVCAVPMHNLDWGQGCNRGQTLGEPLAERGINPGVGLRETLQTLQLAGREQDQPKFTFPFPFSMLQLKQIYEPPILLFLHSVDIGVVTSSRSRGLWV